MARKKSDTTDAAAVATDAEIVGADVPVESTERRRIFGASEPEIAKDVESTARPAGPDTELLDAVDDAVEDAELRRGESESGLFGRMFADDPEPEPEPEPVRSREPEVAVPVHADDGHVEDDAGPGFASRALTWLLLLLAGAGIGIWGAPKLAPMLPSGLAPVAAWLTPGTAQTGAEIASLGTKVDASLGEINGRIDALASPEQIEDRSRALIGEVEARIGAEIVALKDQIAAVDVGDARQRIDQLEAATKGQIAELDTIKQQLSGGAAATSDLGEETAARIDVYRAELEGLRAEVGSLTAKVAGLGTRVDEVAAAADRQVTAAQTRVAEIEQVSKVQVDQSVAQSDLALVSAALADGQGFAEPLSRLGAISGMPIPDGLSAAATTGVASLAQLRASFPDAAHAAIRTSIQASSGDGLLARSRAYVQAQLASRSLTPQEGLGPDAVLSRMEDALRRDDLDGALALAAQLPSEAAAAMGTWLEAARLRAGAESGLKSLSADLPATN